MEVGGQHPVDLTESEMKLIEAELFDEVRWLNWALNKVRQAKKEGRSLSLDELMVQRQGLLGRKAPSTKRPRAKPKAANADADLPAEVPNYDDLPEG